MKEIDELILPEDLRYADDHEWAKPENGETTIGISDYAQAQLGDIVFVELPAPGAVIGKGELFGTVESVKAVAELYMPVGGEVLAVNKVLEESPELVNKAPYSEGWMLRVKTGNPSELDGLMNKEAYLHMLKGLK